MKPHIQKTINEINEDILSLESDLAKLKAMREGLDLLYGGNNDEPEPAPKREPKKAKLIPITPEQKPRPELSLKSHTREGLNNKEKNVERIAVLRKLPEPFTAASFAVASGLDKKLAGITLCGYAARGWLARMGKGSYQRSGAFPPAT